MKKTTNFLSKSLTIGLGLFFAFGMSQTCFSKTAPQQWSFVRDIAVSNGGELATDAVVLVELTADNFDYSKAKEDGSDLRFSTNPKQILGTGLSYWIQQWNKDGISRIWLKIPALAKTKATNISMFYGNASATTVSNGNTTFLFFDDFNDNNFADKWTNKSIASVVEEGGLLKLKENDGETGTMFSNFDVTGNMIVRTAHQRENGDRHWIRTGISGWNKWLCWGDYYTTDGFADGYLMVFENDIKTMPKRVVTLHPDEKWHNISFAYDGKQLNGIRDKDSVDYVMPNASSKLGFNTLDNDAADFFDYISVSKNILPEPTVKVGIQNASKAKSK